MIIQNLRTGARKCRENGGLARRETNEIHGAASGKNFFRFFAVFV
jgi:hypothetical protein